MLALSRCPGEEIVIEPAGLRLKMHQPSRGVDGRWWLRFELNGHRMPAVLENTWTTLDGESDVHVVFTRAPTGRVRCAFDAPHEQRILRAELLNNH